MVVVKSYEEILEEYLESLPEGIDTREGTLAYIAGSAMAIRLKELYEEIKLIEDNCYADTAIEEDLEKIAALLGIERQSETKAVVRMEGDDGFIVGEIFTGGGMEYEITEVNDGYYLAQCNTSGEGGNSYLGEVLPKEDKKAFNTMTIVSIVALGEDVEDDESLRKRYFERLNCPMCTGNMSYYKNCINSITGVGGFKVVPVESGIGTVKVIITDTDYSVADEELINYVKSVLDPEESSGQGYGVLPVGHSVTVDTVEKVDVDIVVEIEPSDFQDAYCRYARADLPEIFKEINKNWDQSEYIVVRDRIIEDYFFELGAKDVNVVSINGNTNRLILEPDQILGGVTINGA